jgi:hypothetical protein
MPFDAIFNAREVQPQQGGGAHPVGNKFPFEITHTEVKPTKEGKGGLFEVELTSPAGSIVERYNLWNENDTTRKIAQQELSALCHATGRFEVDFKNDGAALRGGRGLMDVGFQKGHEPTAEKPQGGYVELKKVYDAAGNEPGKAGQQPQQTAQNTQWAGNAQTVVNQPAPGNQANPSWSQGNQQAAPQQVNPATQVQQGWQQGAGQQSAPWKQ